MALSVFAAARDAAHRPALLVEGQVVDYGELARRTRDAVGWLRRRGLDAARLTALSADVAMGTVEMVHAHIALGVPVMLMHPRLTAGERRVLLEESGSPPVLDPLWRDDPDARPAGADPDPVPDDDRALAVLHTSGTAGRPRAVVLSRRAFTASAAASASNLGWQESDRWLLRLPVAHVGGLSILIRCLLARRAVVLAADTTPAELSETIRRHRATIVSLVPTLLARLLDLDPPTELPPYVRAILLGGAAASPALLTRAADRGWPVLTTYGLTEACSQVTTQPFGTWNRGQLGAGPPLPGIEVRIDGQDQIIVRGPTLLTGYLTPDGIEGAPLDDGWLPTGDHGRLDDAGNLHVTGRGTDRIITGGENVDPTEVEQALERVPGVRHACVFGEPDPDWGEVVCAALVAGPDLEPGSLRSDLDRSLAAFKRPRRIAVLDAIPVGPSGKVDREAVARLARSHLRPL